MAKEKVIVKPGDKCLDAHCKHKFTTPAIAEIDPPERDGP